LPPDWKRFDGAVSPAAGGRLSVGAARKERLRIHFREIIGWANRPVFSKFVAKESWMPLAGLPRKFQN